MSNSAEQSVSTAPPAPQSDGAEAEELPFLAKMLNHLLTPGSSLNSVVWTIFNIIVFMLLLIWIMFVFAMPTSIHVWVFGLLLLGLAVSTNWLMRLVFSEGLDFASQQKKEEEKKKLGEGNTGNATDESKKTQ